MKHLSLAAIVLMASNLAFAAPQPTETEDSTVYAQQMTILTTAMEEETSTLFPQEDNTPVPP